MFGSGIFYWLKDFFKEDKYSFVGKGFTHKSLHFNVTRFEIKSGVRTTQHTEPTDIRNSRSCQAQPFSQILSDQVRTDPPSLTGPGPRQDGISRSIIRKHQFPKLPSVKTGDVSSAFRNPTITVRHNSECSWSIENQIKKNIKVFFYWCKS